MVKNLVAVGGNVTIEDGAAIQTDMIVVGGGVNAPANFTPGRQHVAIGGTAIANRLNSAVPWLTEGLLLSLCATIMGVLLASTGLRALEQAISARLPRAEEITLDWRVALFAVACGLQATGRLPDPSWLPVIEWSLGLSAGMSLLLWLGRVRWTIGGTLARAGDAASVAARVLVATLAAGAALISICER